MSDVFGNFIEPMVGVFRIDAPDPVTFQQAVVSKLGSYTDPVLTQAADWLMVNVKRKTFPSIAECIDACERARESTQVTVCDTLEKPLKNIDAQAFRWMCAAMRESSLGKLSIEEGWDRSFSQILYSVAVQRLCKGGKLPHPHQDYRLPPEDLELLRRDGVPTWKKVETRRYEWFKYYAEPDPKKRKWDLDHEVGSWAEHLPATGWDKPKDPHKRRLPSVQNTTPGSAIGERGRSQSSQRRASGQ